MVWIRYGKVRAIWKCTTARGYDTKYHAVGVSIKDEYEKKPEEDIENWASRLGDFVARRMCHNACGSLSTSVYCDEGSTQSETVYTSEMLVARPVVKEEEEVIEKAKKVEPEKIEEKLIEKEKLVEKIKPKVPTPIEISRAATMIKSLEESAERLPSARKDLLKRANELREKYNLTGVKL